MLVATMTWDNEDPDVHTHFTTYAHRLEDGDPVRWVDTVRAYETALREYVAVLATARERLEAKIEADRISLEAETPMRTPRAEGAL